MSEAGAERTEAVLRHIVESLVDDPDAVEIEATLTDGKVSLVARVGDGDMGRVIGRRGRVAHAIRAVVRGAAARDELEADVDFSD